jgi:acyl-coenzyme A thioesterase PaaI-like protein
MASSGGLDPPITRARLDATAALRELVHELVAADADDATLGKVTRRVGETVALLDGFPRRDRAVPEFTTHSELRVGSESEGHAMSDRAVAGPANPTSVRLDVHRVGDEAVAAVSFGPAFEGALGRVHGGMVAAVIDDFTGFVLAMVGEPGFTGRLSVSYYHPVPIETTIELRARLARREGRKLFVDAEGRLGDRVLVRAEALMIVVDPAHFATPAPDLLGVPRADDD